MVRSAKKPDAPQFLLDVNTIFYDFPLLPTSIL